MLAPQQIASRLENQFRLLKSSRVADERHQTLRATIEWSYGLCSPSERLCWARLSIFPADFDLDAAESVASGGDVKPDTVLEVVGSLIDKSILRATRHADRTRYRFTDPVRDFGRGKLAELEPDASARSRHLGHFSRLAASVPELLFGPAQIKWTSSLRAERWNLAAALVQAVDGGDMDAADSLACAIALVSFRQVRSASRPRPSARRRHTKGTGLRHECGCCGCLPGSRSTRGTCGSRDSAHSTAAGSRRRSTISEASFMRCSTSASVNCSATTSALLSGTVAGQCT